MPTHKSSGETETGAARPRSHQHARITLSGGSVGAAPEAGGT
jgi:hypothetical protein